MKSCALQMAVSCQIMTKLLRLSMGLEQESFLRVLLVSCVVFGVGGWLEALNKVRQSSRNSYSRRLSQKFSFVEKFYWKLINTQRDCYGNFPTSIPKKIVDEAAEIPTIYSLLPEKKGKNHPQLSSSLKPKEKQAARTWMNDMKRLDVLI